MKPCSTRPRLFQWTGGACFWKGVIAHVFSSSISNLSPSISTQAWLSRLLVCIGDLCVGVLAAYRAERNACPGGGQHLEHPYPFQPAHRFSPDTTLSIA